MISISVAEMLKLHGEWIRAKDFVELVSSRRSVTVRQAYNLIRKAGTSQEIMRLPLGNGIVLYGLAEFGPTESGHLVESERIKTQNEKGYGRPKVNFEITQWIYDNEALPYPSPIGKREFPRVSFYMGNLNDYPIKARIEVRMILGGRNLGLIPDPIGHYNGKAEMGFEPGRGFINGNFTVPEECAKSEKELTLEVRVTVIDPDNRKHKLMPKSWTYKRKENDWYYEPKLFTKQ
jgi:hypothetical protein